jgi:drug/metabolite transporter (DMT)-like permease
MTTPAIEHHQKQSSSTNQSFQGIVMMMLVTLIWASMPVMIKQIITTVPPALQIAIRFTLGAVIFVPFARNLNLALLRDGAITGLLFFGGVVSETIALKTIPANQASFIYGLIVIFVTLFEVLFYRRQSFVAIIAAAIAFIGIGIISWPDGSPPIGDVWMLLCALLASAWIIVLEILSPRHSLLSLTFVQLSSVAILGLLWATPELIWHFESLRKSVMNPETLAVLFYLGVVATGITTWLQTKALQMITAFEAGVIETLEPVFGAILAFLILGETFKTRGYIGAVVVIVGMAMALSARNAKESSELSLSVDENENSQLTLPLSNQIELKLSDQDQKEPAVLLIEEQTTKISN